MLRRLPLILGIAAALVVLLLAGPVAVAVALMRSPGAPGPDLAAQILIAALLLAAAALAGFLAWGLASLAMRLLRRGG